MNHESGRHESWRHESKRHESWIRTSWIMNQDVLNHESGRHESRRHKWGIRTPIGSLCITQSPTHVFIVARLTQTRVIWFRKQECASHTVTHVVMKPSSNFLDTQDCRLLLQICGIRRWWIWFCFQISLVVAIYSLTYVLHQKTIEEWTYLLKFHASSSWSNPCHITLHSPHVLHS